MMQDRRTGQEMDQYKPLSTGEDRDQYKPLSTGEDRDQYKPLRFPSYQTNRRKDITDSQFQILLRSSKQRKKVKKELMENNKKDIQYKEEEGEEKEKDDEEEKKNEEDDKSSKSDLPRWQFLLTGQQHCTDNLSTSRTLCVTCAVNKVSSYFTLSLYDLQMTYDPTC